MRHWSIRQEPGDGSRTGRTRQVGTVDGEGQLDALNQYVFLKYLQTGNRQYAGAYPEVRSSRNLDAEWKGPTLAQLDDPHDKGRDWSMVVTLRNGSRNVHTVRLLAWPYVP